MYKDRLKVLIDRLGESECEQIINIIEEYHAAVVKHPAWPKDMVHRAAIVGEEAGELIRGALIFQYEKGKLHDLEREAIQTGAMALRFLRNLR